MKIRTLLSILLAAAALHATAQTHEHTAPAAGAQPKEAAFKGGEKLTYTLKHSYVNSDVVEVVFHTTPTIIDNTPAFKIHANAKTFPGYKMFYDLDDTYETWLDMTTLRPLKFLSRLKEGKYRYRADYLYDWTRMEANNTSQNLKRPDAKHATVKLTPGAGDALTLFYNLRSDDIASFVPGQERTFQFVMDDTVRTIRYKYLGKEIKKFPKRGTFRTLKLSCSLASSGDEEGQTFKDGTEFYLWLSDDQNHIPLYIESPIKFGSIVAVITKWEGLKYPLTSKIK